MSCINDDIIQKYVDGEATPEEVVMIEQHIAGCEKCSLKVEHQRRLANGIKKAINQLSEEQVEIPEIIIPPGHKKKRLITRTRLIYDIAAASVILFVLFFARNREPGIQNEIIITNDFEWDYDANKTVSQQQMHFNIIDSKGQVTEYFAE